MQMLLIGKVHRTMLHTEIALIEPATCCAKPTEELAQRYEQVPSPSFATNNKAWEQPHLTSSWWKCGTSSSARQRAASAESPDVMYSASAALIASRSCDVLRAPPCQQF